jgi:[acyl-carrier-protein] S-malonyltransferase
VRVKVAGKQFAPDAVAGHSLGEWTSLVATGALSFEEGLQLVAQRALAMQKACELADGTMAAVLGMEDADIESICRQVTEEIVVPANYNSPGQLVISGSRKGIELATPLLTAAGAKRVILLAVGGAFHSPLMQPAQNELAIAIEKAKFKNPECSVYQNVCALPISDATTIQANLIKQLTAPVRWSQTIQAMLQEGVTSFVEVGGSGAVLRGMIKKINREVQTSELST